MRRALALAALLLTIAAATGCGAKQEPGDGASSGKREDLRLVLDYFPNADHAGIYAAQASGEYDRAGLNVDITTPPDPAAPTWSSPTSPSCCSPATRALTTWSPSARSCRSR